MKFSHYATRYIGCQFLIPGGEGSLYTLCFCKEGKANDLFILDRVTPVLKRLYQMTVPEKIDLYDKFFGKTVWDVTKPLKISVIDKFLCLHSGYCNSRVEQIIASFGIGDTCALVDALRAKGYDLDGLIEKGIATT